MTDPDDQDGFFIVLRICPHCLLMIEHTHLDTDDLVRDPR